MSPSPWRFAWRVPTRWPPPHPFARPVGSGRFYRRVESSRFVCWAIDVMTLMTLPISALDSPSLATVALVRSATFTAEVATFAASCAFLAISLMLAPISSAPVETVVTFLLTCSAAADATFACAAVSSAFDAICSLTP